MSDETRGNKGAEGHDRDGLLSDLASRILRVGAEAVSVGAEKLREKGETAASLTARGKEEVMTLLANEIRSYVEKLRVGDEVRTFLDDYSLEIKASVRLKTVPPDEEPPQDGSGVEVEVGLEPLTPPKEEPAPEPEPPQKQSASTTTKQLASTTEQPSETRKKTTTKKASSRKPAAAKKAAGTRKTTAARKPARKTEES